MFFSLIVLLALNVLCASWTSVTDEHIELPRHRRQTLCSLPPAPEHGSYTSDVSLEAVGQSSQALQLNVTCHPGYGVVGSSEVLCYKGFWSQTVPKCVRLCPLNKDPSVHYHCLIPDVEGRRDCNSFEPSGTIVRPQCNAPNYHSHGVLPYMRCNEGRWNYVAKCLPECGTVTPDGAQLVAGGRPAMRGEFPWHAGIYSKTTSPYMLICGGSLVTNTVVISAAHCFYWTNVLPAAEFAVAVGKLYRPFFDAMDNTAAAQTSDVKEIIIPARFQGRKANFQDDIALLYMAKAFVYETHVRPVCLDFNLEFNNQQLQPGNIGKVAGWGLTGVNGSASPTLKVVELPYVDIDTCISKTPTAFTGFITSDKICAGYENTGTAVCRGDSGGGLVFSDNERGVQRYYLRGIVSTAPEDGNLCNTHTLTAFTQVIKHEHFIYSNLYRYSPETTEKSLARPVPTEQSLVEAITPKYGDESNNQTSVAQQNCLRYARQAAGRSCTPAPYMALLGYGEERSTTDWTGYTGVIISDRYIINIRYIPTSRFTVGHRNVTRVALGVTDSTVPDTNWRIHEISEIAVHPEYRKPYNDITLLRTDTTIEFSDRVQPACLPWLGFPDQRALLTTFKRRKGGNGYIRIVSVEQYPDKDCSVSDVAYNNTIHVCYGHRDDLDESCNCFIGDPAVLHRDDSSCVSTLVAVMSIWSDCSRPIGFTRMALYVPWIESVVWP